MRDYRLRLEHYGISRDRYNELMSIVRQYDQYRIELAALRRGDVDRRTDGNSVYAGTPDPTARDAVRAAGSRQARRIAAIEQAAMAASPALHRELIRNVARGLSFEIIRPPCGKQQFYAARRQFFLELDARL